MKKKIIASLMAMSMSLSVVACADVSSVLTPAQAPATEASVEATVEATEEASVETQAADEASSEESVEAAAEASSEETEEEVDVVEAVGAIDGHVYNNEYFDVTFELPEGYEFADETMLAEVYGYTTDLLSETADNTAVKKALENGEAQVVALGYSNAGNSITVTLQENLLLANVLMDEKAVLNASIDLVKQSLEAQGMTNINTEIVEEEIAGETHAVLKISGEVQGVGYYSTMINLQKGEYMLGIGATCFGEDNTMELLSNVEALN